MSAYLYMNFKKDRSSLALLVAFISWWTDFFVMDMGWILCKECDAEWAIPSEVQRARVEDKKIKNNMYLDSSSPVTSLAC